MLKEGTRLSKQSEQSLNTLLNGCTELDGVARALNNARRGHTRGHHQGSRQTTGALLHGNQRIRRDQPEEDEREETDEHSSE